MRLHHIQVAAPPGGEDLARRFYADGLGLAEVEKPEALRARGGAWFRAYDATGAVTAELHVGIEGDFRPARKAHPGLVVGDAEVLEAIAERLATLGFPVDWADRRTLAGYQRFHVFDGHGNRVEVLAPAD